LVAVLDTHLDALPAGFCLVGATLTPFKTFVWLTLPLFHQVKLCYQR
jgi:hypothetical protein